MRDLYSPSRRSRTVVMPALAIAAATAVPTIHLTRRDSRLATSVRTPASSVGDPQKLPGT